MNATDSPPRTFRSHFSDDNLSGYSKIDMEPTFNKENIVLNNYLIGALNKARGL